MLNIIFLLQYESSAEKCYYLDTRCSSVDLSRITFIFKAVTGWLVISRHKRCFCTSDSRTSKTLKRERQFWMHLLTKQSGKMWTQLKSMESLSLLVPMPLRGMWWSRCPWVIMLHSKVHILFLWMPTNLWQHSNRVFLSNRAGSCVTVWNTLILVHLYIYLADWYGFTVLHMVFNDS